MAITHVPNVRVKVFSVATNARARARLPVLTVRAKEHLIAQLAEAPEKAKHLAVTAAGLGIPKRRFTLPAPIVMG